MSLINCVRSIDTQHGVNSPVLSKVLKSQHLHHVVIFGNPRTALEPCSAMSGLYQGLFILMGTILIQGFQFWNQLMCSLTEKNTNYVENITTVAGLVIFSYSHI